MSSGSLQCVRREQLDELWKVLVRPIPPQNWNVVGEQGIGKTMFVRCVPLIAEQPGTTRYKFLYCRFRGEPVLEVWDDETHTWRARGAMITTGKQVLALLDEWRKAGFEWPTIVCLLDDFDLALERELFSRADLKELDSIIESRLKIVLTSRNELWQHYREEFKLLQGGATRWRTLRLGLLKNEQALDIVRDVIDRLGIEDASLEDIETVVRVAGPHPNYIEATLAVLPRNRRISKDGMQWEERLRTAAEVLTSSFDTKWDNLATTTHRATLATIAAANHLGGLWEARQQAALTLGLTDGAFRLAIERLTEEGFLLPGSSLEQPKLFSEAFKKYVQTTPEYRQIAQTDRRIQLEKRLYDPTVLLGVISFSLAISFGMLVFVITAFGREYWWLSLIGWVPTLIYVLARFRLRDRAGIQERSRTL